MSVHSWCRDVQRDEAVRASEDNRPGPLPTLEEAIARAGQFMPLEAPQEQKCTERESGLRTERVTLEVTYLLNVGGGTTPRDWSWRPVFTPLRPGESVRVVKEVYFDDLAQVAMERDTAIRERDEAKQHHARECAKCSALADKVIALRARVAELEGQLESVADRAAAAEMALEAAPAASKWRMLKVGEEVEAGDEVTHDLFLPSRDAGPCVGQKVDSGPIAFRRRVTAPAASEWRILGKDEYPRIGDQYKHDDGRWSVIRDRNIHLFTRPRRHKFRRRVTAPAASVVPDVVSEMADILRSNATDDEKHSAIATLVEAVCPGYVLSPAASGAAGNSPAALVSADVVAWGVRPVQSMEVPPGCASPRRVDRKTLTLFSMQHHAEAAAQRTGGTVAPLYAAPQAASGWLTEEQRGSIWYAIEGLREAASRRNNGHARTLESILARSSPPDVVLHHERDWYDGSGGRVGAFDPAKTRAALAAAGVTVKEVGRE